MLEVFADTVYWIALLNERDNLHSKARELSTRFAGATIVTTEMVLTEFLNHVSGGGSQVRRLAGETVLQWMADPNVEVVPQTTIPRASQAAQTSRMKRPSCRRHRRP